MRRKLLLATNNRGKIEEYRRLLKDIPFELVTLTDAGITAEVVEVGESLEENARLKATVLSAQSGLLAMADDSGLEVAALGGEPGVRSKRFAGDYADDKERYQKLLALMSDIPEGKRQARFRCCIAIAVPGKETVVVAGICQGKIAFAPSGSYGFGYDPVFIPEGMDCTMAELPMEEKNKISHRSRALQAAVPVLRRIFLASASG